MQPTIILKRSFNIGSIAVKFNAVTQWQCDSAIKEKADTVWQKKVGDYKAKGITVWDGDTYRLDNLAQVSSVKEEQILLALSIIKYRYVSTYPDFLDYYDAHPESNPHHVSIGAMLKTSDGFWVFGERGKSSTSTTNIDLIGGGLNKSELEINNGADIYRQLLNELHEEAGILPSIISSCEGIGILHSSVSNVLIIAKVQLNVDSSKLKGIFIKRTEDEMQDLVFIEDSKVKEYMKGMTSYRALIPDFLAHSI